METSTYTVTLRRLTAADGYVLTQADDNTPITDRTFGREVTLSSLDSEDNWKEITIAEADALKQQQLAAYAHL